MVAIYRVEKIYKNPSTASGPPPSKAREANAYFDNLEERYHSGMESFLAYHGIESDKSGLSIHIRKTDSDIYKILKDRNCVTINAKDSGYIFRAITILKEALTYRTICSASDI